MLHDPWFWLFVATYVAAAILTGAVIDLLRDREDWKWTLYLAVIAWPLAILTVGGSCLFDGIRYAVRK